MKLRGLYAITPEGAFSAVAEKIAAALDGGVAVLQYRRKSVPAQERLREVRRLLAMCRGRGVPLIVNDDLELALEADADGVHLGRDDGDLRGARRRLGGKILGASCYADAQRARAAVADGADYVAFGSVFASPTKPAAVRAPFALFAEDLGVPRCAIGGITLQNAPQVIAAGADLLAVITDLFEAPDIRSRALAYGRLFP